jgi:hypothetical protein
MCAINNLRSLVASLLLVMGGTGHAEKPHPDGKHRRSGSALVAARQVQNQVMRAAKRQELKVERCAEVGDVNVGTQVTLYRDATGRVRRAHWANGSEDSTSEDDMIYDVDGHLRFVFYRRFGVEGGKFTIRVYLDAAGNVLEPPEEEGLPPYLSYLSESPQVAPTSCPTDSQ